MKFVSKAILDDKGNEIANTGDEKEVNFSVSASAPDPAYDPNIQRTLYERLQEQKDKKEAEFAEMSKLGNMVKRLDEDELFFLKQQEDSKKQYEREIKMKEREELESFRKAQNNVIAKDLENGVITASLLAKPKEVDTKIKASVPIADVQKKVLSGIVVTKKKRKEDEMNGKDEKEKVDKVKDVKEVKDIPKPPEKKAKVEQVAPKSTKPVVTNALSLIAAYSDDEDDD